MIIYLDKMAFTLCKKHATSCRQQDAASYSLLLLSLYWATFIALTPYVTTLNI